MPDGTTGRLLGGLKKIQKKGLYTRFFGSPNLLKYCTTQKTE